MSLTTRAATAVIAVVNALAIGVLSASAQNPPVKTEQQMLRKYIAATFGPAGLTTATVMAGWAQVQQTPPEWGTTTAGYGRRWASKFTETAIGNSAKFGLARLMHHDPSFVRCECKGFGRRLRHAVLSPFHARTPDGKEVLSAAALAGFTTGQVIAKTTWYPAKYSAADGMREAGVSLALSTAKSVFKEFRPRRK